MLETGLLVVWSVARSPARMSRHCHLFCSQPEAPLTTLKDTRITNIYCLARCQLELWVVVSVLWNQTCLSQRARHCPCDAWEQRRECGLGPQRGCGGAMNKKLLDLQQGFLVISMLAI